jgi:hypothetical protein
MQRAGKSGQSRAPRRAYLTEDCPLPHGLRVPWKKTRRPAGKRRMI